LTSSEFVESKLTDKIFKAKIDSSLSDDELVSTIAELESLAKANQNSEIKKRLRDLLASFSIK
jgi:hypothetical protein